MMEPFLFETSDLPSPTTDAVKDAIESGRGRVVIGEAGSGKTHAVGKAVNGAIWSTACPGPLAVPRLVVDLAAQAGASAAVTRAYVDEGFEAAAEALDAVLGDRVVVVDAAERLATAGGEEPDGFNEPNVATLWSDEQRQALRWLASRVGRARQVVLTRANFEDVAPEDVTRHPSVRHVVQEPGPWGPWPSRSWPALARLANAATRLVGLPAAKSALAQLSPAGSLGELLFQSAPAELRRYLVLLKTLNEVPDAAIQALAVEDDYAWLAHGLARKLGLTVWRAGVARLEPFVAEVLPAVAPDDAGAGPLFERLARWMLGGVTSRNSMAPSEAVRVLDAHRLQLALGDVDAARATAQVHVGGLITLARGLSLSGRHHEAYQAYGVVRQLVDEHPRLANPRVRSYVTHYHAYNGDRAGTMAPDLVRDRYAAAVEDWPSNALWHGRLIEATTATGDITAAREALARAYRSVPEHPRRDETVRMRPAFALRRRAPLFALELVDPLIAAAGERNQDAATLEWPLEQLLSDWRDVGLEIEQLHAGDGRSVAFVGPVRLTVDRDVSGAWCAEVRYPPARTEGNTPLSAVGALADRIADETVRLVRTPTGRLARHDVGRKGLYLGAIDLVASELGLPFVSARWLLGRLEGDPAVFRPVDGDAPQVPLGVDAPDERGGMFFARFPVDRVGAAAGAVDRLVPAGSGRNLGELEAALRALRRGDEAA